VAKPFTIIACAALLLCGAGDTLGRTQQAVSDGSRSEEWCGQYECVVSVPLSEEEVQVSLAALAALPRRDESRAAPAATASVRERSIEGNGLEFAAPWIGRASATAVVAHPDGP
jgi:hypothetical protein